MSENLLQIKPISEMPLVRRDAPVPLGSEAPSAALISLRLRQEHGGFRDHARGSRGRGLPARERGRGRASRHHQHVRLHRGCEARIHRYDSGSRPVERSGRSRNPGGGGLSGRALPGRTRPGVARGGPVHRHARVRSAPCALERRARRRARGVLRHAYGLRQEAAAHPRRTGAERLSESRRGLLAALHVLRDPQISRQVPLAPARSAHRRSERAGRGGRAGGEPSRAGDHELRGGLGPGLLARAAARRVEQAWMASTGSACSTTTRAG